MSQYAIETNDGRQVQVADGKATIRRSYVMWGFDSDLAVIRGLGASYAPSTGASATTFVPKIGSKHEDWHFMQAWSYNLKKRPGSENIWDIEFEYRNIPPQPRNRPQPNSGLPPGPDAIAFEEITAKVSGSFVLAYRANPSRPVDGVYGEEGGNIGGQPIDAGGQPTSQMRYQYEITKSIVTEQNFEEQLAGFGSMVGFRGTAFGLDSGSVLYRGASIQRIENNKYRVQHTYLYDSNLHALQVPQYNADGQFDLDEDGHADVVYWKQPFPTAGSSLPGL